MHKIIYLPENFEILEDKQNIITLPKNTVIAVSAHVSPPPPGFGLVGLHISSHSQYSEIGNRTVALWCR